MSDIVIHTCIAKDYSSALAIACSMYGYDIQVIYDKEVIFGIFNKKWIEIGFVEKGIKDDRALREMSQSDVFSLALSKECDRIRRVLIKNDFCYDCADILLSEFASARVRETNKIYTEAENNSYLLSLIEDCYDADIASHVNLPPIFILSAPFSFDVSGIVSASIKNFTDYTKRTNAKKVVLVNYGARGPERVNADIRECYSISDFPRPDVDSGEMLVMNIGAAFFRDEAFWDKMNSHFGFSVFNCVHPVLKAGMKVSDLLSLSGILKNFSSVIFDDSDRTATVGNMLSFCCASKM